MVEYDGGELSITRAMALVFLKQADTDLYTLVGFDLASQGKIYATLSNSTVVFSIKGFLLSQRFYRLPH